MNTVAYLQNLKKRAGREPDFWIDQIQDALQETLPKQSAIRKEFDRITKMKRDNASSPGELTPDDEARLAKVVEQAVAYVQAQSPDSELIQKVNRIVGEEIVRQARLRHSGVGELIESAFRKKALRILFGCAAILLLSAGVHYFRFYGVEQYVQKMEATYEQAKADFGERKRKLDDEVQKSGLDSKQAKAALQETILTAKTDLGSLSHDALAQVKAELKAREGEIQKKLDSTEAEVKSFQVDMSRRRSALEADVVRDTIAFAANLKKQLAQADVDTATAVKAERERLLSRLQDESRTHLRLLTEERDARIAKFNNEVREYELRRIATLRTIEDLVRPFDPLTKQFADLRKRAETMEGELGGRGEELSKLVSQLSDAKSLLTSADGSKLAAIAHVLWALDRTQQAALAVVLVTFMIACVSLGLTLWTVRRVIGSPRPRSPLDKFRWQNLSEQVLKRIGGAADAAVAVLGEPEDPVDRRALRAAAVSDDGARLIFGAYGDELRVWDLGRRPSGPPTTITLPNSVATAAGQARVQTFALSPGATHLVWFSPDRGLRLWDLGDSAPNWSGKLDDIDPRRQWAPENLPPELVTGNGPTVLALSRDGKRLAAAVDGARVITCKLNRIKLKPSERIEVGPGPGKVPVGVVDALAFAPSGCTVAVGGPNGIAMWKLKTFARWFSQRVETVAVDKSGSSLAFGLAGEVLAVARDVPGTTPAHRTQVVVYQGRPWAARSPTALALPSGAVTMTRDGHHLAVATLDASVVILRLNPSADAG